MHPSCFLCTSLGLLKESCSALLCALCVDSSSSIAAASPILLSPGGGDESGVLSADSPLLFVVEFEAGMMMLLQVALRQAVAISSCVL